MLAVAVAFQRVTGCAMAETVAAAPPSDHCAEMAASESGDTGHHQMPDGDAPHDCKHGCYLPAISAPPTLVADIAPNPSRTYAAIGIEGVAPYWLRLEGSAFVSTKGDVHLRAEGSHDHRIIQRLIVQPRFEASPAAQDVPELGIGAGLSDVELGLRFRHEIVPEFAPYVGVEHARKIGDTARFARTMGEGVGGTSFVAGVRLWF
ncbi:MAG: copper resistance protein B [Sphingopyxis sp.]|nr:copper resistance protein B [Sphingopyxis sp.]